MILYSIIYYYNTVIILCVLIQKKNMIHTHKVKPSQIVELSKITVTIITIQLHVIY